MPEAARVRDSSMLPGSSGARVISFMLEERFEAP